MLDANSVHGVGVDIESVDRFHDLVHKKNNVFLNKVFTKNEQKYCFSKKDPAPHFAVQFCAKESVVKALCGLGHKPIEYRTIEIFHNERGVPCVRLIDQEKLFDISLSMSHCSEYAMACVMASKNSMQDDHDSKTMISAEVLKKFGYPETVIKEYPHWWLLVAPVQHTLGTVLLIAKEGVQSLGELSEASFVDLAIVTQELEMRLRETFQVDRFNYLWLMMATREVHAAVIPRYAGEREFQHRTFTDPGWPKKPNVDFTHTVSQEFSAQLIGRLRNVFNAE